MESGHHWSGHERNVAFLNTGNGRFAHVASLTGFDFPSDGRALAIVDWDHDGDMDVWMTQRTAPRLRFLRNDNHGGMAGITLSLESSKGNASGVGARVEATLTHGRKLIRSLRAGEGYLSQSGLKCHFGLGKDSSITHLKIQWPDGTVESQSVNLKEGSYHFKQGQQPLAVSQPLKKERSIHARKENNPPSSFKRLIPHSPLNLPPVPYLSQNKDLVYLKASGKRQLIVLWATWCLPCLEELEALQRAQSKLKEAGLEILTLNLDQINQSPEQRLTQLKRFMRKRQWVLNGALANTPIMEMMDAAREAILGRQWTWSIPSSFLLNEKGQLIALYEGSPSVEQLLEDQERLFRKGKDREHALPYPGSWYVDHYPPDQMSIPEILYKKEQFQLLTSLLYTHPPNGTQERQKASFFCVEASKRLAQENPAMASTLLELSESFLPGQIEQLRARAMLDQAQQKWGDAMQGYEALLRQQPGDFQASVTLAWFLAVLPSGQPDQPKRAWALIQEVLEPAKETRSQALDIMGAVQASMGNFEQAARWAEKALESLPSEQRSTSPIQSRLSDYRSGKPYRLSPQESALQRP